MSDTSSQRPEQTTFQHSDIRRDLDLALALADSADHITMQRFQASDLHVISKPDLTPVSDADTAVEERLREILSKERPEDAILGEEYGGEVAHQGRQWVIDPIDGTKNFVRGVPVWATLISLLIDGVPVVGVVSAPALSRRWWGAKNHGAWGVHTPGVLGVSASSDSAQCEQDKRSGQGEQGERNTPSNPHAKPLQVSGVSTIEDASLAISSLSGWADRGLREELIALSDRTWRLRGYGDFWSYMLLAEGAVDIAAEPEVSLWDLAALVPIVEEAGGRFSNLEGIAGPHGGSAVATNGVLHEETLAALRGEKH